MRKKLLRITFWFRIMVLLHHPHTAQFLFVNYPSLFKLPSIG